MTRDIPCRHRARTSGLAGFALSPRGMERREIPRGIEGRGNAVLCERARGYEISNVEPHPISLIQFAFRCRYRERLVEFSRENFLGKEFLAEKRQRRTIHLKPGNFNSQNKSPICNPFDSMTKTRAVSGEMTTGR